MLNKYHETSNERGCINNNKTEADYLWHPSDTRKPDLERVEALKAPRRGSSRPQKGESTSVLLRASQVEISLGGIIYLTLWSRGLNPGVRDTAAYYLRPSSASDTSTFIM